MAFSLSMPSRSKLLNGLFIFAKSSSNFFNQSWFSVDENSEVRGFSRILSDHSFDLYLSSRNVTIAVNNAGWSRLHK